MSFMLMTNSNRSIVQLPTSSSIVTPFFTDDFSSGDLSKTMNGFTWTDSAYTSVSTERSRSGTHSLKFGYYPTSTPGESWAEQRFNLGAYYSQVWVEYYLWVPSNFVHVDQPSGYAENNKFFQLWRDEYSDLAGGTQQVGFEYWRNSDGTSYLRSMNRSSVPTPGGGQYITDSPGSTYPTVIGPTGALIKGQWNRIRIAAKGSSERGVSDGYLKLWINETLVENITGLACWNAFTTPTDVVFRNGYILGYANAGFTEQTDFFVDDFAVYSSDPQWESDHLLFWDDFSSGNLTKTMNGCYWGDASNLTVNSGFSHAGYLGNAVKFNFDIPITSISELRFWLNQEYPELWLGMRIYMPMGTESPSVGPKLVYPGGTGGRNKLLRLWSNTIEDYDSYTNARRYPIVGAQWQPDYLTGGAGVSAGDAGLVPGAGVFPYSGGTVSQLDADSRPFLTDANRGRWITLEMYAKRDDDPSGGGDGIVRWYLDGKLLTESLNLNMYEIPNSGFGGGYIMGAVDRLFANAGSCLYMDFFGVSTTRRVF